jgi:maltose alpha-D-glucosyltransferase/alpha-amylase
VGAFAVLQKKLDYVPEVGVDTLRLLRFCSRPRRCTGYDIADYRAMRPDNGTLAGTRRFVNEANKRWMDVMTELVIALTSDQHPWSRRVADQARIFGAARLYMVRH